MQNHKRKENRYFTDADPKWHDSINTEQKDNYNDKNNNCHNHQNIEDIINTVVLVRKRGAMKKFVNFHLMALNFNKILFLT